MEAEAPATASAVKEVSGVIAPKGSGGSATAAKHLVTTCNVYIRSLHAVAYMQAHHCRPIQYTHKLADALARTYVKCCVHMLELVMHRVLDDVKNYAKPPAYIF